ncbi:TspO/MBR family protein [Acidithiobacillus sp. AMEEHan]|uniref:TspO/MBR family protein n=1 Tax=Acidithiobacillus sp. AMEEHan TaxID=2994951 RepID=UPI0027E56962|nr:TspO/MBR family protein [Acidithiobacillus sp. AMEEHan]
MEIFFTYLVSLLLSFATAATGARFRPDEWYQSLRKPSVTPTPWVFPVVWTVLYVAMALAAAQIWLAPASPLRSLALLLYALQLLANGAWSWIFFGLHRVRTALLDLSALFLLVLLDTLLFFSLQTIAGILLLPYLLWLAIAWYLNAGVWWLNRARLA